MPSPYEAPSGVPYPPSSPHLPPPGYEPPPFPDPRRRRGTLSTIGLASAILLAIAALVVGIIGLNRPAESTSTTSGPSSAASPSTSPTSDTTAADRALCNAIAPLMKRSTDERNALVDSGPPGSPAQDAALPKFTTDTQDWAKETQGVLARYSEPPRHITRTLQRYIDDMLLFVETVRPGPGTKYDEAAWVDSTVALGGPMRICYDLGVQW
jgi:hypothetical protein